MKQHRYSAGEACQGGLFRVLCSIMAGLEQRANAAPALTTRAVEVHAWRPARITQPAQFGEGDSA